MGGKDGNVWHFDIRVPMCPPVLGHRYLLGRGGLRGPSGGRAPRLRLQVRPLLELGGSAVAAGVFKGGCLSRAAVGVFKSNHTCGCIAGQVRVPEDGLAGVWGLAGVAIRKVFGCSELSCPVK